MRATELIRDIQNARNKWDERSSFRIKGVKNLSLSDIDTAILYAETGGQGLMKPCGEVAALLEKYGYIHPGS